MTSIGPPDSHNTNFTVAANASGGFAVAWQHAVGGIGAPPEHIEAQIFDASNNASTGVISVPTAVHTFNPALDWLGNGNLVVTYNNSDTGHVDARIFDSSGAAVTGEIDVGAGSGSPDVVALTSGNFAVVWSGQGGSTDTDGLSIHGRIYSAAGTALTADFTINTTTPGDQQDADAVALPDGTFYVTRDGPPYHSGSSIFGQLVDGSGHLVGNEIPVNRSATLVRRRLQWRSSRRHPAATLRRTRRCSTASCSMYSPTAAISIQTAADKPIPISA